MICPRWISGGGRTLWVALVASVAIVAPVLASEGASGAADEQVLRLQRAALSDPTPWVLLESLTTEVGPRMGGSPGDALAVSWAQSRMAAMGFDRVRLEPVTFPRWERRFESARLIAPRGQSLAVTALGGSPGTGGALRAEVVRFADLEALKAAAPAAVEGKVVFIARRMRRERDGAGYGPAVAARTQGPYAAAEKGAAALVIRSVGTDSDRLPHTGVISSMAEGAPVPAAAISNPDADLLEGLLDRAAPVVLELNLDCGFDGEATSYNVIGEFDGREGTGRFVAVGGHLDSWDLGTGAIDDGAGVAITMAAARLVADLPGRPRHGVRVVLFANEEQGVYGGKAYAAAHADDLGSHVVGAESDLGSGRIYGFATRVRPEAEAEIERLETMLAPLGIPRIAGSDAFGGADFSPMRRLGMAVVDLRQDASRYFDLHHTPNDTLDKVDASDLRFNTAAFATLIYWAADSATDLGPVPLSD